MGIRENWEFRQGENSGGFGAAVVVLSHHWILGFNSEAGLVPLGISEGTEVIVAIGLRWAGSPAY